MSSRGLQQIRQFAVDDVNRGRLPTITRCGNPNFYFEYKEGQMGTLLHLAASNDNVSLLRALVEEKKLDPSKKTFPHSFSLLQVAEIHKAERCEAYLKKEGTNFML